MKLKNLLEKLSPTAQVEIIETCDGEAANVVNIFCNPLDMIRLLNHNVIAIGVPYEQKISITVKKAR